MQRLSQGFAMATVAIVAFVFLTCVNGAPTESDVTGAPTETAVEKLYDIEHLIEDTEETPQLLINGLFEGDLKISEDMIIKSFNFSSIPGGEELLERLLKARETEGSIESNLLDKFDRNERAATLRENLLGDNYIWEDGIIRYQISGTVSSSDARLIRRAMDEWEDHTCLRFLRRTVQTDYVVFTSIGPGCFSTAVGRAGGRQEVNLGYLCDYRLFLHEIGHVIGFWHEQSRPDRDDYVTINFQNVRSAERLQFLKRPDWTVDYQNSTYDYGSILHYNRRAFANCPTCTTIDIANIPEYNRQGRPSLGTRAVLSASDTEQANRLYHCPGTGTEGLLSVRVKQGYSENGWFADYNNIDNIRRTFIRFTFIDSDGNDFVLGGYTRDVDEQQNPIWNQWIYLNHDTWQFFRINAGDVDFNSSGLTNLMSETVIPRPGNHFDQRHCVDTNCTRYITYDYRFISPDAGSQRLHVNILYAQNLCRTESALYVRVGAATDTAVTSYDTGLVNGTTSPRWDECLDFNYGERNSLEVQIRGRRDDGSDYALSNKETFRLQQGTRRLRHNAICGGYLIFEYQLRRPSTDPYPCNPNPCQNGGTCADRGCGDYECFCTEEWYGSTCQYAVLDLTILAQYARNVPGNPYLEFTAISRDGTQSTARTNQPGLISYSLAGTVFDYSLLPGTRVWNHIFRFGPSAWQHFFVQVWQGNGPYPLSRRFRVALQPNTAGRNWRITLATGFVVFSYEFS